jgi:hypothetical protein
MPDSRRFSGTAHLSSCGGFIVIMEAIEEWLKYIVPCTRVLRTRYRAGLYNRLRNFADDPEYMEVLEKLRARCNEFTTQYTRPEIVAFKKVELSKPKAPKKPKRKRPRK